MMRGNVSCKALADSWMKEAKHFFHHRALIEIDIYAKLVGWMLWVPKNDACVFSKKNENYRLHVSLISEDFEYQTYVTHLLPNRILSCMEEKSRILFWLTFVYFQPREYTRT